MSPDPKRVAAAKVAAAAHWRGHDTQELRVRLADCTPDQVRLIRALIEAARQFSPTQQGSAARDKPADPLTETDTRHAATV